MTSNDRRTVRENDNDRTTPERNTKTKEMAGRRRPDFQWQNENGRTYERTADGLTATDSRKA